MDIKTYILHCKCLTDRYDLMARQIDRHNFSNVVWYTDHDANEQNDKDISDVYKGMRPKIFTQKVKVGGWDVTGSPPRTLNYAEISLTTKLGKVLEEIGRGNEEYALILEDDAILINNFSNLFDIYLKETPDNWDVIYMGDCANLHARNITHKQLAYKVDHPASKGCDSILIKKSAAATIANTYFQFDLCSDWEIGYQQAYHDLNVYWWEPNIVTQGSQNGTFKSTLR